MSGICVQSGLLYSICGERESEGREGGRGVKREEHQMTSILDLACICTVLTIRQASVQETIETESNKVISC